MMLRILQHTPTSHTRFVNLTSSDLLQCCIGFLSNIHNVSYKYKPQLSRLRSFNQTIPHINTSKVRLHTHIWYLELLVLDKDWIPF